MRLSIASGREQALLTFIRTDGAGVAAILDLDQQKGQRKETAGQQQIPDAVMISQRPG